ncbi:MAG: peptidoglycan editing factor PgeF [Rhodanobacteraceae bacterium]|nr:MAG: peptidoglycan editing factor PgeF [Rhodanobacteraceae bacterium]
MNIDWIKPAWPAPPHVQAIVTTRDGPGFARQSPCGFNVGARCGDDPAAVAENRTTLREALSLPSEPRWLRQVHGNVVARFPPLPLAGEGNPRAARMAEGKIAQDSREPQADAAVTRAPGVVLAIQTADCLPVLFCVDDGSEIAAAHAGWRGLSSGVLEATLAAMQSPRENIMAWLGPAIAASSYEVGDEVRDAFLMHDSAARPAFTATRSGHWLCDLDALARQRLRRAGVTRIHGGTFDTFTDSRLHSYRRDGARSGRMASLVWAVPQTG